MKTNIASLALLLTVNFCLYAQTPEPRSSDVLASNTEDVLLSNNNFETESSPSPIKFGNSTSVSKLKLNTKKGVNKLVWQGTNEKKCKYIIQRGVDNQRFEDIGIVSQGEILNDRTAYSFEDDSPLEGINYYRIKKVKKKKDIFYSQVMGVSTELSSPFGKISNFETPFFAQKLQLESVDNIEEYGLYSQAGIQVDGVLAKNRSGYTFDFKEKPSAGLYVLLTKTETQTHTYRIIIN